ncbi:hypothetical protein D3C75_856120 [compost metagenome]
MPGQQAGHGDHAHQQRQGEQGRNNNLSQRLAGGGGFLFLTGQQLLTALADGALRQLGTEAKRFYMGAQGSRGLGAGHQQDAGLLEGEIDLGRDDARQGSQLLVQPRRTTGTGHAADLEGDRLMAVAIALPRDAVEDLGQTSRVTEFDGRLLQREVDAGRHAVELVEGGRDAAGAVGAAHAADGKLNMHGHDNPPRIDQQTLTFTVRESSSERTDFLCK